MQEERLVENLYSLRLATTKPKELSFFRANGLVTEAGLQQGFDTSLGIASIPFTDCDREDTNRAWCKNDQMATFVNQSDPTAGNLTLDKIELQTMSGHQKPQIKLLLQKGKLDLKDLRSRLEKCEAEMIMTRLADVRGIFNPGWNKVEPYGTIEGCRLGNYVFTPDLWADRTEYLRLGNSYQSQHFASWQTTDELKKQAKIEYDLVRLHGDEARGKNPYQILQSIITFIDNLAGKSNSGFEPAKVRLPNMEDEYRSGDPRSSYVALVPPQLAEAISHEDKCKQIWADPAPALGRKEGAITRYIGLYRDKLLVLPCDLLPRYTVEVDGQKEHFTRALILGRGAMRAGYSAHQISGELDGKNQEISTPYRNFIGRDDGEFHETIISIAHLGTWLKYDKDAQGSLVARGRAIYDILDKGFIKPE